MAEQIYDSGSGYYNPQSRKFQPTLSVPMLESPALRGYVQDEMSRIQQDTKNVQSNISTYKKLKDAATGLDLSPANAERFEQIRKNQYDIKDDLANLKPEEFANPFIMDQMEDKVDRLFKDPEVKRIFGSEAYADKFREKTFQISNQALREKAQEDYRKALDGGYESILGLNINNYKPMNPMEPILDLSKQLPTERVTQDGGDGYLYTVDKVTDDGLENLKKQMEYKYRTDARFRNNFDAKYGQNFESVSDYIDNLKENGAFLDTYGKPKKKDGTTGGPILFKDIKKNLTGTQRDVFDDYTQFAGKVLTSPAPDGLQEAIAEAASRDLSGTKAVEYINEILNDGGATTEKETRTEEVLAEGKWINEEGNILDVDNVREYQTGSWDELLDMSSFPTYAGNYDEVFGDGTKDSLLKGMETDYKGKVDSDGNLLTSNARWVYEEYLGQTQSNRGNVKELKSIIDDRDDIEFVKASKGIPAHFKIKGKEVSKNERNNISDVEVGEVKTFPTDRGEARPGVPKGYSSSKANNPFNVRPGSGSNTFNVYETMEQGFKDGMKLLDRYYEGKNTSLIDNKERYFDTKGEPVTLKELVYTWSPPEKMAKELGKGKTGNSQEVVDNYLSSVAKSLGVDENTKLQDIDKEALALQMVRVECPKCYEELTKENTEQTPNQSNQVDWSKVAQDSLQSETFRNRQNIE